jgi:hypothetical protein
MAELNDLKYNMVSAPERYAEMGFPEKYKVTITERVESSFFPGADIHLYEWMPTFSRWRKRYLGHQWILLKSRTISFSNYWDDEDADRIARAWLFEIKRHDTLRNVEPVDYTEMEEAENE